MKRYPLNRCGHRKCRLHRVLHKQGKCPRGGGEWLEIGTYVRPPAKPRVRKPRKPAKPCPVYPDPSARCGRALCGRILRVHVGGRCPGNPDKTFHVRRPLGSRALVDRIALSVNDRELVALQEVLAKMQSGGDARVIAIMRRRELGNVLGILTRARKRIDARKTPAPSGARTADPGASPSPERVPLVELEGAGGLEVSDAAR